ncbi:hypothetical protein ALC60_09641 [Trachymyrmex zeteki]|uniref:Uncharacterized protein n=1 Tax=Mycetomoellerius zeteki TaxID=64791 RepID=A0A151WTL1_9HYME|nr:hypothetical protein ALC60_09641 [Trachymyrmex zeteki]
MSLYFIGEMRREQHFWHLNGARNATDSSCVNAMAHTRAPARRSIHSERLNVTSAIIEEERRRFPSSRSLARCHVATTATIVVDVAVVVAATTTTTTTRPPTAPLYGPINHLGAHAPHFPLFPLPRLRSRRLATQPSRIRVRSLPRSLARFAGEPAMGLGLGERETLNDATNILVYCIYSILYVEKSLGSNTKPVGHSVSFGLVPLAAYRSSISRMRTNLVRTFTAILVAMSQQRSARPHSIHVPDLDATPFRPVDLNRSENAYGAT